MIIITASEQFMRSPVGTLFEQLPPPLVLAVRRVANLEPVDAVRGILSLGDNAFQVVVADQPKQSGTVAIEMPGQQDAWTVADDALQDFLPLR